MKRDNFVLAEGNMSSLILKYTIPAIISFLVSALYNIVDQIFIGHSVGMLGNAATNVSFPLVTISTSVALLIGVGSAANFNLKLGQDNMSQASKIIGGAVTLLISSGLILTILTFLNLEGWLTLFGATESVLPYALTYTSITTIGLPFFVVSTGGAHLIRADGRPALAMFCSLFGAVINTVLNPIFIFVLDMGIAGAALATIIGQIISGLVILRCMMKSRTVNIKKEDYNVSLNQIKEVAKLGAAPAVNQIAIMITQIVMNNVLTYYGTLSVYGSEIPLAVVGVISKVNVIFLAFTVGIAQGTQPIVGYNYGAKKYERVKDVYLKSARLTSLIAVIVFIGFQFFPRQIISIFGSGDDLYYEFATQYFRIFMFMTLGSAIQPLTGNFFTSIGKAQIGAFIALTRQLLFLIPLLLLLPIFFGINGVLFAGPIADTVALFIAIGYIKREFKLMDHQGE